MSMLNVSMPTRGLSHALTVKCAVLILPPSRNGPTASNSAPLLDVAQKLELERNPVNELASSMSPLASMAWNLPCTPDASDVTSKVNVITPPDGMVPVPLISPVWGGGGWFHACSLGLNGSRASLHAVPRASSATAAADAQREVVGFMELFSWRDGFGSPWGKTRTGLSCAQHRAARRPDAAQPHRRVLRQRSVACERHHGSSAWPMRSTVVIVSASAAAIQPCKSADRIRRCSRSRAPSCGGSRARRATCGDPWL